MLPQTIELLKERYLDETVKRRLGPAFLPKKQRPDCACLTFSHRVFSHVSSDHLLKSFDITLVAFVQLFQRDSRRL